MSGKTGIQWTEATGRRLGRAKQVAQQLGLSVQEYLEHRASGDKWCYGCHEWHQTSAFAVDHSRQDGLTATCTAYRNGLARGRYQPKPRKPHGWLVPARSGDRKQARRRVNYLVEQQQIPEPNALACSDCGHVWHPGDPGHEYDHHLGYSAAHQLDVQAVCVACHHAREAKRGRGEQ